MKSFLAGAFIALGCCLYISIPDKIIGAICFSMGLLGIRILGLNLFTGKTQFFLKRNSPYKPQDILMIFVDNCFGVAFILFLTRWTPIYTAAQTIGLAKNAIPIYTLFFNSIMCGILMTIATYKDTPLWVSSLAVLAFIAAGFNHSVADTFYFIAMGGWVAPLKILIIAFGNLIGGRLAALTIRLKEN